MSSGIAFVNGRYVIKKEAMVNIEDRGYQFADGVYEVIAVSKSRLIDLNAHLDRLSRSLAELEIAWPCERRVLILIFSKLLKRNHLKDGIIYLQITRGVANRNHSFPANTVRSSLVVTVSKLGWPSDKKFKEGVTVVTMPENRWCRPDIKSISLLGNVLAKEFAHQKDSFETWFLDFDQSITEGSSTNAWIVLPKGELVTRQLGRKILGGITRGRVIELARAAGMLVSEKPFSLQEAFCAEEAFITSTTSLVMPVIKIDGKIIGSGKPGPITIKLKKLYDEFCVRGEV
jgi:D-alanine transaminase